MLKRLLTISRYSRTEVQKIRNSEVFTSALPHFRTSALYSAALLLCCSVALSFSVSCAPKHVGLPSYEGIQIENAVLELKKIKSIEAVLSIDYEKDDSIMSGDASLNVSEDKLNLKLYYLGFLAGEVIEDGGVIKSNPKLDKSKSTILVDGLKNSFFWWNIKDYSLLEKEDTYELKNSYRKILVDKKTLLPIQQTIELHNGEELKIFYDAPSRIDINNKSDIEKPSIFNTSSVAHLSSLPLWYNSQLKIEFKNYIVKIKVKSYSITR